MGRKLVYQILEYLIITLRMRKHNSSCVHDNKIGKSAVLHLVTPQQENFQRSYTKVWSSAIPNNHDSGHEIQQSRQDIQITEDDNQKLSDMVSELFSKNKISSKNAFQVPLVNVSDLKSYYSQDEGSWSKMSSTLENSSRIYGFRVDSVNQNIIKMTNNMSRSMINDKVIAKQNNDTHKIEIKIEDKYDNTNLQLHLDEEKLKEYRMIVEQKCSLGDKRTRRMLDQNGVAGLILANVGLSNNLCLSLDLEQIKAHRKQLRHLSQSQINLPISIFDNIGLNIFNQIYNKCQDLLRQKSHKYQQSYEMAYNQYCNQNILKTFFEQTNEIQQQPDTDANNYQSFCFISLAQENRPIKRQLPNNSVSKYIRKKPVVDKKKKKNVIKKSKILRKAQQHEDLFFDSSIVLSKQNVMKGDTSRSFRNVDQQNSNPDKNVYILDDIFSVFHLQVHLEARQAETSASKYNQNAQTEINIDHLELQTSNELQMGLISIDLQAERDMKCPSIKQTKQQLLALLAEIENIKFSHLCEQHGKLVQSSTQAMDFVSVLHLCNELNLSLAQINCYDFLIQK